MSAFRYRVLDAALQRRLIPDAVLRAGSRRGAGLRERETRGNHAIEQRTAKMVGRMSSGPIAEVPEKANEQHYGLPPTFLELILGPRMKYSGCLWEPGTRDLAEAEEAMLALTCERAQVEDGMRILDLGCGWGSLSLWLAERYPKAEIFGVSNSAEQRAHIERRAAERGLRNLTIITADVNEFTPPARFDRVLSIEMFEHMRNWKKLLHHISTWLEPGGKLFVHVFSHRTLPYVFESSWAAERFFTAGTMPSHELISKFGENMRVAESWAVPGTHYARTLRAWLENLDSRRDEVLATLRDSGRSDAEAKRMLGAWRLFFISTEEIWGYDEGRSWQVSHYLLEPTALSAEPLPADTELARVAVRSIPSST